MGQVDTVTQVTPGQGEAGEQQAGPGQVPDKRRWLRQGLGIAISVGCLWLIFRRVNMTELRAALSSFQWHFVAVGVASLGAGYAIRIKRWAMLLQAAGASVTARRCAAPFLGSITLNNVLPFRAGDLIRALVFPAAIGVSRTTAMASLLSERLIDLLTLLLSLGIGLSFGSVVSLPEWFGKSVLGLSLLGGSALFAAIVFSRGIANIIERIRKTTQERGQTAKAGLLGVAASLVRDIGLMSRPSGLLFLFLLSMMVWVFEAGLFWAILAGLGLNAGFAGALMVMALATLSTLVPSSPGYVGPFHLAAFSAAVMLGGSDGQATSFAVLAHLGLWLPTTLAGTLAILANPQLFKHR